MSDLNLLAEMQEAREVAERDAEHPERFDPFFVGVLSAKLERTEEGRSAWRQALHTTLVEFDR